MRRRASLSVLVTVSLTGCFCTNTPISANGLGGHALTLTENQWPSGVTHSGTVVLLPPPGTGACFTVNPAITVTANGVSLSNDALGGFNPPTLALPGCSQPTWTLPEALFDGGTSLALVFTDSSGSASATFPQALTERRLNVVQFTLEANQVSQADWLPEDDRLVEPWLTYSADGGSWFLSNGLVRQAGQTLSFTSPSVDAGSAGVVQLGGRAALVTSACTGFGSCTGTIDTTLELPATYR